jgi:hypothetical protein
LSEIFFETLSGNLEGLEDVKKSKANHGDTESTEKSLIRIRFFSVSSVPSVVFLIFSQLPVPRTTQGGGWTGWSPVPGSPLTPSEPQISTYLFGTLRIAYSRAPVSDQEHRDEAGAPSGSLTRREERKGATTKDPEELATDFTDYTKKSV